MKFRMNDEYWWLWSEHDDQTSGNSRRFTDILLADDEVKIVLEKALNCSQQYWFNKQLIAPNNTLLDEMRWRSMIWILQKKPKLDAPFKQSKQILDNLSSIQHGIQYSINLWSWNFKQLIMDNIFTILPSDHRSPDDCSWLTLVCLLQGTCIIMQCPITIHVILCEFKILSMGNKNPLTFAFASLKEVKINIRRVRFP